MNNKWHTTGPGQFANCKFFMHNKNSLLIIPTIYSQILNTQEEQNCKRFVGQHTNYHCIFLQYLAIVMRHLLHF